MISWGAAEITLKLNLCPSPRLSRNSCEQRDVVLQANSPAGLHEVLAAHAAKIRIMENQIAQLRTLLNEVDVRKAPDLVVKAVKTNELTQHDSRIVKTEPLIEIACE